MNNGTLSALNPSISPVAASFFPTQRRDDIATETEIGEMNMATAASYVVSPHALRPIAAGTERSADQMSASYMIALGVRVVREVGDLWRRARQTSKRLATLSIDTEIRFRSAGDMAKFTRELSEAISTLAARYHDETAAGGRVHRVVLIAHPLFDQDANGKEADKEEKCH